MKNTIFLLINLMYITCLINAQSTYYDAISLKSFPCKYYKSSGIEISLDSNNISEIYSIIGKYLPSKVCDSLKNFNKEVQLQKIAYYLKEKYSNPFISFSTTGENYKFSKNGFENSISKSFSSIGNLNVTNFADGLAKFLVERSKEELNVAFFRKFQDYLKEYPEVKFIFPTTCDFMQNIYSYQYAAMLPALKAAFLKDFNSICSNLINLRNLKSDACSSNNENCITRINTLNSFLNNDDNGRSIIGALIVADNLIKGNNAAQIINNLANDNRFTDFPDDNLSNLMQFADLISKSIRCKENDRVWINKDEINNLISDDITLRIYLGLLYASNQNMKYPTHFKTNAGDITLQKNLDNAARDIKNFNEFVDHFKAISIAASEISDNAQNILVSKSRGEQSSIIIYADYAASIANFFKISMDIYPDKPTPEIEKFEAIIGDAVNFYYDIKSQNYGLLVIHSSKILGELLGSDYPFKDEYIKYGTFMANIVQANNSDEVKEAIEAAVLPVGSSSIKRETEKNISINAFIGAYGGREYMPKLKEKPWAASLGVTAPVGLAFSWGKLCCCKCCNDQNNTKIKGGKSFTIFVPLIDIGSVASYRISDDSSNVASDITLSNIVSPGLYFYYGFGKCPISIGIGAQVGPQLRSLSATNINVNKNIYLRFGASLVVDIPLFNLYTKN